MRNRVEITGIDTSKLKTIPNEVMMELIVMKLNATYQMFLISYLIYSKNLSNNRR